jgi:hypothetical protein
MRFQAIGILVDLDPVQEQLLIEIPPPAPGGATSHARPASP